MANEFREGATIMDVGKRVVAGMRAHAVRWLVKGPGSSWLIAGTFAFAGFSAAALTAPSDVVGQQGSGTSGVPALYSGCYMDPDGDGHIFCDGTVAIDKLPASYGQCYVDPDGDGHIFCDGRGR